MFTALRGSPEFERAARELAAGRSVTLEPSSRAEAPVRARGSISEPALRRLTHVATTLTAATSLGCIALLLVPSSLIAAGLAAGVGAVIGNVAAKRDQRDTDEARAASPHTGTS
ncbi:MAG: hypothetical protein ACXU8N_11365 [Telluria sp.]